VRKEVLTCYSRRSKAFLGLIEDAYRCYINIIVIGVGLVDSTVQMSKRKDFALAFFMFQGMGTLVDWVCFLLLDIPPKEAAGERIDNFVRTDGMRFVTHHIATPILVATVR
jgi:hypothetical protein